MAALTPKAIIEGRSRSRPAVPLIIGLVLAGGGALLVMISYFVLDGATNTIVSTFMALPVGAMVVAGLLWLDRFEPEPPLKLLFAFLWGCGVAALIALVVNTLGIALLSSEIGVRSGLVLGSSFLAPIVEESLKGSVLLILLWRRRDEINGVTDCVLYAGMVAMGFAVIEDINYFAQALGKSGEAAVVTWVVRTIFGPIGHPAFTAATGVGIAYAATGRRGVKGVLAVVGGWCVAVFLHMSWNLGSQFGLIGLGISLVFILTWIAILIVLMVIDRRRLIGTIQHFLPQYIPTGIVTPVDIAMLSSLRTRREARRAVRGRLGAQAARAMSDYQLAATELALLHASASSRTVTPQRFAFRQQGLTWLMGQARQVFIPPPYPPQTQVHGPAPRPGPPGSLPGPSQPPNR
ncbi:PrsW family intramembrane metalloprotease [Microlunatus sp. Gsoil 973]|uniref:PrsW family intramembrane metalloprotease n=1 Tax=Microlunatus sp. Gsoil 973 TaxID=2672569 RepID=UPI0012B49A9D|nr:PrsW family intramembrane metalloprotease [Microlunatus sp. Gsoil 973]QGN32677.1 PrsW family intramembrane metalloprotease [Microlunatus sp. Gsoil 973]